MSGTFGKMFGEIVEFGFDEGTFGPNYLLNGGQEVRDGVIEHGYLALTRFSEYCGHH